jgi:HTH-type transcriptional regulator/antitoxin HigA
MTGLSNGLNTMCYLTRFSVSKLFEQIIYNRPLSAEVTMMNSTVHAIIKNWQPLAPLLSAPYTEEDYANRVELLNQLIDEVGDNEQHPLASLLDTVGILVANYEQEHYALPASSPQEVLAYLLEEHQLTQSQLPEVGSQGVVSEILNGKRELNKRQIQALAKRFGVSPEVFF